MCQIIAKSSKSQFLISEKNDIFLNVKNCKPHIISNVVALVINQFQNNSTFSQFGHQLGIFVYVVDNTANDKYSTVVISS